MKWFLLRWLISAFSLLFVSYVIPGIEVQGFFYALIAAALLGILNAIIRPILVILTLPLTILTLGLFILVINGLMLLLVSAVIDGFVIHGFWAAFWGALMLSVISWLSSYFLDSHGRVVYTEMHRGSDGHWR